MVSSIRSGRFTWKNRLLFYLALWMLMRARELVLLRLYITFISTMEISKIRRKSMLSFKLLGILENYQNEYQIGKINLKHQIEIH